LNVAVQCSGDPLQGLIGEARIVDGSSERDRTDQRDLVLQSVPLTFRVTHVILQSKMTVIILIWLT
jgi:hypothetical protein